MRWTKLTETYELLQVITSCNLPLGLKKEKSLHLLDLPLCQTNLCPHWNAQTSPHGRLLWVPWVPVKKCLRAAWKSLRCNMTVRFTRVLSAPRVKSTLPYKNWRVTHLPTSPCPAPHIDTHSWIFNSTHARSILLFTVEVFTGTCSAFKRLKMTYFPHISVKLIPSSSRAPFSLSRHYI